MSDSELWGVRSKRLDDVSSALNAVAELTPIEDRPWRLRNEKNRLVRSLRKLGKDIASRPGLNMVNLGVPGIVVSTSSGPAGWLRPKAHEVIGGVVALREHGFSLERVRHIIVSGNEGIVAITGGYFEEQSRWTSQDTVLAKTTLELYSANFGWEKGKSFGSLA